MKTALVTGASSGIGAAIAERLLRDGYRVFAGARRTQRMRQLAADGAVVLPLDVTDDASMVAAVRRIEADAGPVNMLVNNAGYGSYGSLEEVPIAEGRRQFEVNVFGLARLTQLVLPAMRERRSGAIVNISSMGGKIYEPFGSWYHATKFAVEGMSDCLRLELEPYGIRVIVIEPGGIRSEWGRISHDNLLAHSGDGPYAATPGRTPGSWRRRTHRGSCRRRRSSPPRFRVCSRRAGRARAIPAVAGPLRSCSCARSCRTACSTGSCGGCSGPPNLPRPRFRRASESSAGRLPSRRRASRRSLPSAWRPPRRRRGRDTPPARRRTCRRRRSCRRQ